ncbi:MAG: hypothetical protein QNK30_05670 [Bacteroidales bacterium]|nr:hypothetical protein [Bacteroidales bacterium]
MKQKFSFFLLLMYMSANLFSQTIYVVDKNPDAPTGDHVFNDLQLCIDNASAGDMIHIIPAVDDYGSVSINKELHLVGSGWIPDSQTGEISKVNTIVFLANQANGSSLNGLVLTETKHYPIIFGDLNAPLDTLKNIEIYNCKVPGILQRDNCPIKNVILRNNVFATLYSTDGYTTLNFDVNDGMTENLLITNNIIGTNYANGNIRTGISAANQTLITNNLLFSRDGYYFFFNIRNCFITNNVFYGSSAKSYKYGSTVGFNYANVYSNNLSFDCTNYGGCDIPPVSTSSPVNTGSGNLTNTDPLYENIISGWVWKNEFSLTLLDYSPLPNAGTDGTDIGIMGGQYPFKNYNNLRGVPYVHKMSVPALILQNQPIELDAEGRTNK